jgi:hypothetical protein
MQAADQIDGVLLSGLGIADVASCPTITASEPLEVWLRDFDGYTVMDARSNVGPACRHSCAASGNLDGATNDVKPSEPFANPVPTGER